MSTGPPSDPLRWSTEEGVEKCPYDRDFLRDPTCTEGIYCKKCGWEVSKHPAAPPPPAAAAAALDVSSPLGRQLEAISAGPIASATTWWTVRGVLTLKPGEVQSFRSLLAKKLPWPVDGSCPALGTHDNAVTYSFYTDTHSRALDIYGIIRHLVDLCSSEFSDIKCNEPVQCARPAALVIWRYEQGLHSPRDDVLPLTDNPSSFPMAVPRSHEDASGHSSATHENAHVICRRKFHAVVETLTDAVRIGDGHAARAVTLPLKHAAHKAFDELAYFFRPTEYPDGLVRFDVVWRRGYQFPANGDDETELRRDVLEARWQRSSVPFKTLNQALTVHRYMVQWADAYWPNEAAVVAALRDEWCMAGLSDD